MFRRAAARDEPTAVEERTDRGGLRGRRARRRERAAGAAATAAGAFAAVVLFVSRLIRLAAGLLALVIALGIALVALDANTSNSIVSTVHDAARSLVGPFDGIFKLHSHKLAIAVNWGIALLVYLIVGSILASLVARLAFGAGDRGSRRGRTRTAAA